MNKKIMAISLLVIVAAISISGCLGPNEDELYNEKMTEINQDMVKINKTLDESSQAFNSDNNNSTDELMNAIDTANAMIDNDTGKLKELNESISNTTRKEYIGICVDELEEMKEYLNVAKDALTIVKDVTAGKMEGDLISKVSELTNKADEANKNLETLDEKRLDFEKKYTFVLINGTQSPFLNEPNE